MPRCAPAHLSSCNVGLPADEDIDSSDEEKEEESEDEAEWMRKLIAGKLSKGDKLVAVDHSQVQYPPFRCGGGVLQCTFGWVVGCTPIDAGACTAQG